MAPPRKYDRDEWVPKLCAELAKGSTPLTVICRNVGIPLEAVRKWRKTDEAINAQFDEAFELGCDATALECQQIADEPEMGEEVEYDAAGNVVKRRVVDMLGHRKLKIYTRLQLLAKWNARYADKQKLEHTGADGKDLNYTLYVPPKA